MDQLKVDNNGSNNVFEISKNCRLIQSNFSIKGNNISVVASAFSVLNNLSIVIEGNSHRVHIGERARISGKFISKGDAPNGITVGSDTSIG